MPFTRNHNSIFNALGVTFWTATGFRQLICLICAALFLTHVHSDPDQEHLEPTNKPDWLKWGTELTPELIDPPSASELEFRDPYGGAKLLMAPLARLEIDGVRVESAPEGEPRAFRASLNPARNRLIITSPAGPFYVTAETGEQSVKVGWDKRSPLLRTNYCKPPLFTVNSWVWLDDSTAISPGEIDTEDGYNTARVDLFVFDINSNTIRRVNLDKLGVRKHPVLSIIGTDPDERTIRITLDDEDSSGLTHERTFFLKIPGE